MRRGFFSAVSKPLLFSYRLFLPISKHEMGTQTLYNPLFIKIMLIVNTELVSFLKTRLFRWNCLLWLRGGGSALTFFLQNRRGNDFCDVRLENNVKRQYATVSHEFEWKSLYWDKIVLRRIHSVAVNAWVSFQCRGVGINCYEAFWRVGSDGLHFINLTEVGKLTAQFIFDNIWMYFLSTVGWILGNFQNNFWQTSARNRKI